MSLQSAITAVFRQQKLQADSLDKELFQDWNSRLATAIRSGVESVYLLAAKGKDKKTLIDLARMRANEMAKEINYTSSKWIQEGKDSREVFGNARVNRIVETETANAREAGKTIVAAEKQQKLTWVTSSGEACDWCRRMNGRSVMAGKAFGVLGGEEIFHPPSHPGCRCVLKVR